MKAIHKSNRDGSERVMLGKVIWKEKPAHKKAHRLDWQHSKEFQRLREIEKVIRHRHGGMIPDPVGTDDFDLCISYLRAVALTPRSQDVASWCSKWAPWIDPVTLQTLSALGLNRRWMIKADAVAKMLLVTMEERSMLGLRTIGACDMDREERNRTAKATKQERDRNRQEQKRRAEGRADRKSYEAASLSKLQPWLAEGITRRTWERRRVASLSRIEETWIGDTLASKPENQQVAQQSRSGQARAAGLSAGLGDHPPAGFQGAAPLGNGDGSRNGRVA
ncbi:hypothetical protein [Agrobacterium radiobacter]|uniref:hypothetical protein n=1 Tax=Agrobacterium radiobacter TaxID=362 RepID=UPI000DDE3BF4